MSSQYPFYTPLELSSLEDSVKDFGERVARRSRTVAFYNRRLGTVDWAYRLPNGNVLTDWTCALHGEHSYPSDNKHDRFGTTHEDEICRWIAGARKSRHYKNTRMEWARRDDERRRMNKLERDVEAVRDSALDRARYFDQRRGMGRRCRKSMVVSQGIKE